MRPLGVSASGPRVGETLIAAVPEGGIASVYFFLRTAALLRFMKFLSYDAGISMVHASAF